MNPLTEASAALRFALDFAQMTSDEVQGARDRVRQFMQVPERVQGLAWHPTDEILTEIQRETANLLRALVPDDGARVRIGTTLRLMIVVQPPP